MRDEIDKILRELGNPVLPEPSDNFFRVRRNCLLASSLILTALYLAALTGGSVALHIDVPVISVTNVTLDMLWVPLLLLQMYLLAHFTFLAAIYVQEIRIRITGTFAPQGYVSNSGKQDGRAFTPKEASRYSNLYNWWSSNASLAYDYEMNQSRFERLEQLTKEFHEANKTDPNILNCINRLSEVVGLAREANNAARQLSQQIKGG